MHELIDELVRYHRAKAAVLTEMQLLFPAVEKGNANSRDALGILFESFRCGNEKAHHHNEELILDELRRGDSPIHARIERTAEEHIIFGQLAHRLCSEISGSIGEPAVVVANVEWFLNQYDDHASNEETILFPAAERKLSASGWSRVRKDWIDLNQ